MLRPSSADSAHTQVQLVFLVPKQKKDDDGEKEKGVHLGRSAKDVQPWYVAGPSSSPDTKRGEKG